MKHRFLIGIGSQRAGSTLLHSLLAASARVFMHPLKELHYFDTWHGVRAQKALTEFSLRQMSREVNRIVGSDEFGFIDKPYRCYLRANRLLAMQPVTAVDYLDLFRPCLGFAEVLGEVTPEYMLLDDAALAHMREVVGADATIVLICRNPVRRVLSAVKLMNSYNGMNMDDAAAEAWLARMLDENTPWMQAQDLYNDYGAAIARYRRHFERFLAISYDELTQSPAGVAARLAEVGDLDIDVERFCAGTARAVNALGDDFAISGQAIAVLEARYAEVTAQARALFGYELQR